MASDHIVVDVEIKVPVISVTGGWDATDKLGVSCAVVYDYQRDKFSVFGDTDQDLSRLQDRILVADRVTTYNGWHFDYPVIWGYSRRKWSAEPALDIVRTLADTCDDLLRRIWIGRAAPRGDPDNGGYFLPKIGENHWKYEGLGLDAIATGTLGHGKSGHGVDAPVWYQRGEWGRLCDYCLGDVAIERDLGNFMERYGYVVHRGSKKYVAAWQDDARLGRFAERGRRSIRGPERESSESPGYQSRK